MTLFHSYDQRLYYHAQNFCGANHVACPFALPAAVALASSNPCRENSDFRTTHAIALSLVRYHRKILQWLPETYLNGARADG